MMKDAVMIPTVSVVIPAYNAENFIENSINSVLQQTYIDFELIVINDCSKDRTANIVSELAKKDERIIFLQNKINHGVSFTQNLGISKARGKWIAFLDCDDLWEANKLEKQMALIKAHPDAVLTYTASSFIDYEGRPYSYIMAAEPEMTYKKLLKRNLLSCSSVIVRKDVISRIKMADDKMHEDYSAWLLILRETKCAYGINEPLLIYRISQNSKSSNRLQSAKMIYHSYRYVGYNHLLAVLLMLRYSIYSVNKRYKIKNS